MRRSLQPAMDDILEFLRRSLQPALLRSWKAFVESLRVVVPLISGPTERACDLDLAGDLSNHDTIEVPASEELGSTHLRQLAALLGAWGVRDPEAIRGREGSGPFRQRSSRALDDLAISSSRRGCQGDWRVLRSPLGCTEPG